jgi:hypothetical protein
MTAEALMKTMIIGLILSASTAAFCAPENQSFKFEYKTKQYSNFTIVRSAKSKEEAFKLAAKDCFKHLTHDKYPGEEKGLEIIDICANPKI